MLKPFFNSVKAFVGLITLLLLAALTGFVAWGSWQLYENEKLSQQFFKEGIPVEVEVTDADRQAHSWYDQFTNPVYLTFNHQGHTYTTRFVQDSGWIAEGDRLTLLYHSKMDAFRQPGKQISFDSFGDCSRLINFTVAGMWSDERKWQLLAIGFTVFSLLLLSVVLGALVHLPWLKPLQRFIFVGLLLAGSLYITYSAWQYYRYYQKIKSDSREETVTIISTDYHARSRKSNWWFRYEARVQSGNQQKVIPIEKSDFEKLRPNDRLQVFHNSELNDMMPLNYSPDHSNIVVALFFWLLTVIFARKYWS